MRANPGVILTVLGLLVSIAGLQPLAFASGFTCHGWVGTTVGGQTQLHCEGDCPQDFPECVDVTNPSGMFGTVSQCLCHDGQGNMFFYIGDQTCETQTHTVMSVLTTDCYKIACGTECEVDEIVPPEGYMAAWECLCQ